MSDERTPDPDIFKPERYPVLEFPPEALQRFAADCEEWGIEVGPEKLQTLAALYSHLVGVNEWMNLTRLTGPEDYLKYHILDSLTVLTHVDEVTEPGDLCVDLGSGGGYPGLPLMLWLPDRRWVLVDSRRKKVAFLKEAIGLTGCRLAKAEAFRGREAASAAPGLAGSCRLVVARAVGPAARVAEEAAPLLAPDGFLLLLKGPAYAREEREELERLGPEIGLDILLEETLALEEGDPERTVVLLNATGRPEGKAKRGGSRSRPRAGRPGRGDPRGTGGAKPGSGGGRTRRNG